MIIEIIVWTLLLRGYSIIDIPTEARCNEMAKAATTTYTPYCLKTYKSVYVPIVKNGYSNISKDKKLGAFSVVQE